MGLLDHDPPGTNGVGHSGAELAKDSSQRDDQVEPNRQLADDLDNGCLAAGIHTDR